MSGREDDRREDARPAAPRRPRPRCAHECLLRLSPGRRVDGEVRDPPQRSQEQRAEEAADDAEDEVRHAPRTRARARRSRVAAAGRRPRCTMLARLPRCAAAPATAALRSPRACPGTRRHTSSSIAPAATYCVHTRGPVSPEPEHGGDDAGHDAEQQAGALLVHEAASDDEQRDPQDAGVARHVQRDADHCLAEHGQVRAAARARAGRAARATRCRQCHLTMIAVTSRTRSLKSRLGLTILTVSRLLKSRMTFGVHLDAGSVSRPLSRNPMPRMSSAV